MTNERRGYVVDRLEGDRVVLEADAGGQPVELPLAALPIRVKEAMVLVVPIDAYGKPRWELAERDEAEERRRLEEGRARLERLRRRDPGGDIET